MYANFVSRERDVEIRITRNATNTSYDVYSRPTYMCICMYLQHINCIFVGLTHEKDAFISVHDENNFFRHIYKQGQMLGAVPSLLSGIKTNNSYL